MLVYQRLWAMLCHELRRKLAVSNDAQEMGNVRSPFGAQGVSFSTCLQCSSLIFIVSIISNLYGFYYPIAVSNNRLIFMFSILHVWSYCMFLKNMQCVRMT